ncbi:MAG TPA: thiamine pyrophosphate-binding protein [Micropepsaceae bacterium]|nr:thiamine pyrophosphate-binding protein [Micropepsaceae bacterium]
MRLDRPEGTPDPTIGWGSDIAAEMLRRFGIPFVSLNPGASYRGLHDSLVNHLGNENPGILLCLHEDHSVAIAHGYARVTGEPMACVLHANVGLFHGMMGMFNAWCDRAPMLVLGATGPLASEKRRPWIDWIHTMRDQASLVRGFVKWDDQPSSPDALVESLARANLLTRSHPTAPVYVCLDAGLQEAKLEREPAWPDLLRFQPPAAPRPAKEAVDAAAAILSRAGRPVILAGRGARSDVAWQARIRLAERLGAVVMSDLKSGAMFPTDHPAHVVAPFNALPKAAREILCEADAILSLDWIDLGGALKQAGAAGTVSAKIVGVSMDQFLHNGAGMEYQALAPADVFMATTSDAAVAELLAALGPGKKAPWKTRSPAKRKEPRGDAVTLDAIATALRAAFNDPERVTFSLLNRGWPSDIWPFTGPLSYLGKDGGGGLGSGPGLSVGAAVALERMGRYAVSVLGDGDFCMGATAIWTAVRHRIPMLILIDNNRSYFNDELHQENVARARGRDVRNRWIGLRMEDPMPDIATLARAQGAIGIGPVTKASDVAPALEQGVAVLNQGGVCVIDFHVDPGEDRTSAASVGQRKTS